MVGSTEDIDRVGDKMYMSGCRLENYLKNPVILANHAHGDSEKPTVIGKALEVTNTGTELIFKIQFADTANAIDWYKLYAGGYMNASSVGFNSIKSKPNNYGGYDYLEWELLELSLVSIPCNQNAIQHALSEGVISKSMFNIATMEGIMKKELEQVIEEEEKVETEEEVTEEVVEEEKELATEEAEEEVETEEEKEVETEEETEEESEEEVEEETEESEEEEVEEKVCEPEEVEKSLNKKEVIRKIKFVNDGGNKMNKYEQFREYCLTAKSLTGLHAGNGGAAVLPEGFVNDVVDAIAKDPVALRNFVHVYPTTLRTGKIPVAKTEIGMKWAQSDAAFEESNFAFEEISYAISDVLAYTKISNDLIADTPVNLYNELLKQITSVLVKMENAAIICGDGENKPEGIMNEGVEQVETTGSELSADDILALPYEIDVTWRQNGMFIVPSKLMKKIRLMKNAHGDYLFVQGSVVNGAPATLAGYPVVELASVGEEDAILFGDLSQYYLIDRQSLVVEMNDSAAFTENRTIVRFGERIDGKVAVKEAFVVLKERA